MKTYQHATTWITSLMFRPITVEAISLLNEYFNKYPSRSCDFSLAGVMMWVEYYNYEFAECHDTLFIRGIDPESGVMVYYQPLGEMAEEEWKNLITEATPAGMRAELLLPIECDAENQDSLIKTVNTEASLKEYLYPIERFTGFGGKKMEKKRNHLNYFIKNYTDAVIEPISQVNCAELIAFTENFSNIHEDSTLALYENHKTIEVLSNFSSYPFIGIAIRLHGEIIGYTFGEKIGDTFFVHVEKGDINYRGVYQALASNLSQLVNKNYPEVKYLNREEDMGDESLRKSKESYHPTLFVNKRIENISALYGETLLRIA
ncbi:MAG: phosphatidylglycerol lysyltransferase domain-containing protein [Muribaculaceae bacterium]|nr:phosphatidylglycerol lysyltransferase domain-containing protein [Muribaculaceae bacterium]